MFIKNPQRRERLFSVNLIYQFSKYRIESSENFSVDPNAFVNIPGTRLGAKGGDE